MNTAITSQIFGSFRIPDKEQNYQSYMVYVLTIIWSLTMTITVGATYILFPELSTRYIYLLLSSVSVGVFNLAINHFVSPKAASWTLPVSCWVIVTLSCYTAGGIQSPHILTQMIVILTAAFLLGWRAGVGFGLLSAAVDLMYVYMANIGTLPEPVVVHTPLSRWIGALIPFGTILLLQYYATLHLRTGLSAMKREMIKREDAEKIKDETLAMLSERVKELQILYKVGSMVGDEDMPDYRRYQRIVEAIPEGWQYPELAAARISVADAVFQTNNFKPSEFLMRTEKKTGKGTVVSIEVVYLENMPQLDEGPFFKEERSLINSLADVIAIDLDRREKTAELKDYKYALDLAAIVSISDKDGNFTFVNENFCAVSGYTEAELTGKNHSILWSGHHEAEYFEELQSAMQSGKPFHGEFCNKRKDGSLYWVDTSIIPFINDNGYIYQYLTINTDITEKKIAEEKIHESEQLLRKLTSQVPANTYMFEITETGHSNVLFMNRGTDPYNHSYNLSDVKDEPQKLREVLHEEDKEKFNEEMKKAYINQSLVNFQYRILVNDNIRWRWIQAVPEKGKDGKTIWYGATSDITQFIDYLVSIEQMIFDLSHVIRRPVSNILGITKLIQEEDLSEEEIKKFAVKLYKISAEMDEFTMELNNTYNQLRGASQIPIDVSNVINRRKNLFG